MILKRIAMSIYRENKSGASTGPWRTPQIKGAEFDKKLTKIDCITSIWRLNPLKSHSLNSQDLRTRFCESCHSIKRLEPTVGELFSTHQSTKHSPRSLRIIKECFGKIHVLQMFFWVRVSPRTSFMDAIFVFQCLSDSGVMNSDLDWCKRRLQFLQCHPWVFVTSWMSHHCTWRNFRRSTTSGKVWHYASFFLMDNGFHCGFSESKCLWNSLQPFPDWGISVILFHTINPIIDAAS